MLIDCENNVVGMYTCMTQLGHTYLKSCCLDIILQQNGRSVDRKNTASYVQKCISFKRIM